MTEPLYKLRESIRADKLSQTDWRRLYNAPGDHGKRRIETDSEYLSWVRDLAREMHPPEQQIDRIMSGAEVVNPKFVGR